MPAINGRKRAGPWACSFKSKYLVVAIHLCHARREKLIGWELNPFEHLTGVVGGADALFIRHAIVVCRDHHLDTTLQLNDGKQAQRDVYAFGSTDCVEIAVETACDVFWQRHAVFFLVAAAFCQLAGEANGLCYLQRSFWCVAMLTCWAAISVSVRGEDLDIAFAAEENHFFGEGSNALTHDRFAFPNTIRIHAHIKEKGDVNGIEPFVERNAFDVHEYIKNSDVLHFDIDCLIDNRLCQIGKINTKIFQAIFIKTLMILEELRASIICRKNFNLL